MDMSFTAPNVKVLLVDDNKMNLKLVTCLLASFQMQVDSAESGRKALDMLQEKHYHLILMDYMMPEMDGVETTQIIRAMEDKYYREIPVIALTAEDGQDISLFLKAGMNDFLRKPIEKGLLEKVLQKWLPKELVDNRIVQDEATMLENNNAEEWPELRGIDIAEGIKNSGGKKLFISLLGDFYKLIDIKSAKLEKCIADNLIKEYTIEVHALKNTARMIGAIELSEAFARMEQLGKINDVDTITRKHSGLLALYRSFKPILESYGKSDIEKKHVSVEQIIFYLRGMQDAVENFDMDMVDKAMAQLDGVYLPDSCNVLMEKLRAAVADVAMENILIMTEEMISFMRK